MDDAADAIHRNRQAVAGAGGVIAFLLFWFGADWGFFWGLIGGLAVYGLLLLVITLVGRSDPVGMPDMAASERRGGVATAGGAAASGGGGAGATSPAVTGTPVGQGAADASGTPQAYAPAATPAPVAASEPAALREPAGSAPAPEATPLASGPLEAPAMPVAKAPPESAIEAGPESSGTRPPTLDAPRSEGPDDLQRIRGVGPKLEALCNRLGFWHYDQIAAWSEAEVEWVDRHLEGFRGRVRRDDWVAQARALTEGRADAATGGAPV